MEIQIGDLVEVTNTWHYNGLIGIVERTRKRPKLPLEIVVILLNPRPEDKTKLYLNIENIERLA